MARSRGYSRLRTGSASRRKTGWEEGPGQAGGGEQTISATGKVILGAGASALNDGLTVVRTRGQLLVRQSTSAAANNGYTFGMGICIVSSDAFAVGITAIPGPITDMDWDGWFYHDFGFVQSNTATTADIGEQISATYRKDVDSKAMRKLGINDTIVAVFESTLVGTAQLRVFFDSRVLIKLP